MGKTRNILLFMACVLLMPLSVISAQQDDCNLDLSQINALAQQAQTQADAGDIPGALQTITDLRAALSEIQRNCGGDAVTNFGGLNIGVPIGSVSASDALEAVLLSQTFTATDLYGVTLTISYPDSWVMAVRNGFLVLANSEEALPSFSGANRTWRDDDISAVINQWPTSNLAQVGISDGASLGEALAQAIDWLVMQPQSDVTLSFSEPEIFAVGDRDVAISIGTTSVSGVSSENAFGLVQDTGGYVLATFSTLPGQMDQYMDTILAIAESVEYEVD